MYDFYFWVCLYSCLEAYIVMNYIDEEGQLRILSRCLLKESTATDAQTTSVFPQVILGVPEDTRCRG